MDQNTYTKADAAEDKKIRKKTFQIYVECLKPSWKYVLVDFLFILADATFELLIPYLLGLLIRNGIEGYGGSEALQRGAGLTSNAMIQIWMYTGIVTALAILAIAAQSYAMKLAAIISSDFVERLRNTIFWKVEEFSFSNISRFPVAKLSTLLSNDCNNIRFFVLMLMRAGLKSPLMIIVSFIFIFSMNWLIGLIALPISVTAFALIVYVIWKTRPEFVEMQTAIDDVNSNIEEDTEGIREVKAFCREPYMEKKFGNSNEYLTDVTFRASWKMAVIGPITTFAISLTIGIIQYVGGWSMLETATDLNNNSLFVMFNNGDQFDAGELSMLANFTAALTMAFSFLSMLIQFYGRSQASKERIDKVLNEKIDISYAPKTKTKDFDPDHLSSGHVQFKGAYLTYVGNLDKSAVGPIDLDVPSGTVVGIVGGTGSGKSSMVNLIPRLYDASKGEVIVGEHDVKDYSVQALRNDIGVVLQQNVLFTGTIRSNILWGKPDATDEEIWEALDIAQATEFVKRFKDGLDSPITQGGRDVSGGQKQRLCIARAVIKKPKILILDDSTSACDMRTERLIKAQLFTKLKDTTIFIIAQRISSVKDADVILVLDNGHIVGKGTHDELLQTCEIYKEIDEIQKKGVGD